jgi:hypothetical protein
MERWGIVRGVHALRLHTETQKLHWSTSPPVDGSRISAAQGTVKLRASRHCGYPQAIAVKILIRIGVLDHAVLLKLQITS